MKIEKQNAYIVESVIRAAKADEQAGLGIGGLLILCTVARLGRPPVRAIAKSTGSPITTTSAQATLLVKDGWLVVEEDEIYMVNHFKLSTKAEALFAPTKLQAAEEAAQ